MEPEPDAPLVVLREVRFHGVGPPQPSVAIWADGRILFAQARVERPQNYYSDFELREGRIARSRALSIARVVAANISEVPRHSSTEVNYETWGGQVTNIFVRDHGRWRGASVYGAYEEAFLETARAPGILPRRSFTFGAIGSETVISLDKDPPPRPFAEAYQLLVESRPPEGTRVRPFQTGDEVKGGIDALLVCFSHLGGKTGLE